MNNTLGLLLIRETEEVIIQDSPLGSFYPDQEPSGSEISPILLADGFYELYNRILCVPNGFELDKDSGDKKAISFLSGATDV